MSTVAEQLRTAREARNLTVHQVAETTKIRTDHIRALEGGNFDVFSAPVYIRGFVRVYATLLKLDVKQIMSALDKELGGTEKFREPPPLTNQPKGVLNFVTLQLSKVNWRKSVVALVVGLVVVAVVAIAAFWLHRSNSDPLADLPPAVYEPSQPNPGEVIPPPPSAPRK
jgi:cytoskeletal protein RodZ